MNATPAEWPAAAAAGLSLGRKVFGRKFLAGSFRPQADDLSFEHVPCSSDEKMLLLNARDCAVVFSLEHDAEKPAFGLDQRV